METYESCGRNTFYCDASCSWENDDSGEVEAEKNALGIGDGFLGSLFGNLFSNK